jgi:hypothetical protein
MRSSERFLLALAAMTVLSASSRAADSRVIYMVIQTHPTTTVGEVRQKFDDARKSTPGCSVKDVLIEPVDPDTYATLRSIVTRGTVAAAAKEAGNGSVSIEPLGGADGAWCIDLHDAFSYIDAVEVELAEDPLKKTGGQGPPTVTVSLDTPNPDGFGLKFHSPGRYLLSLPQGRLPRAVRFRVASEEAGAGGQVAVRDVAQAWPEVGRTYLVTLSDVKGNEALLFSSLQDASKVGNPIKEIQDATKATLMVASFMEVTPMPVELVDGRVVFNFPVPPGVDPKRLWVMFPLTNEQIAKEKAALDEVLAKEDGFQQLPKIIRGNLVKDQLAPRDGGKWVEVPRKGANFSGAVALQLADWQQLMARQPAAVGDRAILVYEFEGAGGSVVPIKMDTGYVVEKTLPGWGAGLRAAP